MTKKTVKDLNKDFEFLIEKVNMLKTDYEERINVLKSDHEVRIKYLEDQIVGLKPLNEPSSTETAENKSTIKCRECSFSFQNKSELKIHILALHPKQYKCKLCANIFDTSLEYELHLKTHMVEKNYKCEICDQSFYMKWRLGKHIKQHEMTSFKYCHFFNNNKFCQFEELGCMFNHDHAPMCTSGKFCRSKRCQFKHEVTVTVDDELDANNVINENEVEPTDDMECEECTFNTDESVYHKNDIIQECSQCDFETKCEAAYDAHWASTPGHRFSQ